MNQKEKILKQKAKKILKKFENDEEIENNVEGTQGQIIEEKPKKCLKYLKPFQK